MYAPFASLVMARRCRHPRASNPVPLQPTSGQLRLDAVERRRVVVERLRREAKHGNHGRAAVLELRRLQLEEALVVGVGRKAEGVEVAARVAALLEVRLRVARKLDVANDENLDDRERVRVERKREARVLRVVELDGLLLERRVVL